MIRSNRKSSGRSGGEISKARVYVVGALLLFGFSLLGARLYVLQVSSGKILSAQAAGQYRRPAQIDSERGDIYINQENTPTLVATNREQIIVYAVPKEVENPQVAARLLSGVLEVPEADLVSRLSDKTRSYVVLAKDITEAQWNDIESMKMTGVRRDGEVVRFYPQSELLAHVLGFVGYKDEERIGLYGLEGQYEKELSGQEESGTLDKITGLFAGTKSVKPTRHGGALYLTIDQSIQFQAERILHKTVQQHGAEGGCILVMDAKTGSVVAMASNPEFDPNKYSEAASPAAYNNLCTSGSYEPGSVFKPVTMAAALDAGVVTPDTEYEDTGEVQVGTVIVRNSSDKVYGKQNMSQVLEQSINTGVIYVKDLLGNGRFKDYVDKFGFGHKTGVGVPESSGNMKALNGNNTLNYHSASFGQGILVTPMQLARAYTVFTNSGNMLTPNIVERLVRADGSVEDTSRGESERIISERAAKEITSMLIGVVENGHGKRAGVPGYFVAGKTGTAQVARKDGRGYEADINIGSFVGYAPAKDPKFIMVVRVDNPRSVEFAESTAAPAFGELAKFLLTYYKIPPTR